MTHTPRPRLLDSLERQLTDAVQRETARRGSLPAPRAGAGHRWGGGRLWGDGRLSGRVVRLQTRTAGLALLGLLALAAAAFAATSLLPIGSTVAPSRPLDPEAGVGSPSPHGVQMLSHTVADPEGGLPWGMRIVHTSRGLTCLQIGRVQDGQLGQVGIDGAFHDDGRFHPLSPDSIRGAACNPTGSSLAASVGAEPSGIVPSRPHRLAAGRWISYGALGPNAASVTYETNGHLQTLPVEPHTGAYLIVLPAANRSRAQLGLAEDLGIPSRTKAGPVGALTAITYRSSEGMCEEAAAGSVPASHPCPQGHLRLGGLPGEAASVYRRPVHLSVQRTSQGEYFAKLSFTAPVAVTNATSSYIVGLYACGGYQSTEIQRDVRKDELVRDAVRPVLQKHCTGRFSASVQYFHMPTAQRRGFQVPVGEATASPPVG